MQFFNHSVIEMAVNCAKFKKNLEYILFKGITLKFLEIMFFFWLSCNPENFVYVFVIQARKHQPNNHSLAQ